MPGMSSNAYSGKVVLIKRGAIAFTTKVKNAQDHGAAAVVVYSNVEGEVAGMAGADASITIPSMVITQSCGETLRAAVTNGPVKVTMKPRIGDDELDKSCRSYSMSIVTRRRC